MHRLAVLLPLLLLAACQGHDGPVDPTGLNGTKPGNYAGVRADEVLRFTGTEPFWGGSASATSLTYTTPEKPEGVTIPVRRFAGNNGMGLSGTLEGKGLDMAVTEAACSDGMSDRSYPLTVSLRIGDETRMGCGWTDRRGFTGGEGRQRP